MRKAPPGVGMGERAVLRDEGALVAEVYAKQEAFEKGNHQLISMRNVDYD